jgi:triosephosphate isomerase (TIM)
MRNPIAAGNWKMNYGPLQAESFAGSLREPLSAIAGADVVIFPPFISLYAAHRALAGSSIQLGAQNLSDQTGGAFTGEVSAGMIAELCSWVIIGHSERRQYYQETDQLVSRKTQVALDAGLTPIVCVGEHLEDREANLTERVITTQIRGSLDGLPPDQFGRVVVAYEPVWAIGTGRAASRQDADDVIAIIRALVGEMYGRPAADNLRVLYGGSVTAANIAEFAASPEIDGALVGGASLKPEFVDIARIIADRG